ncbi:MAG: hypothetical protein AB1400_10290 [Pseudomonadota bacterium]
MNAKANKLRVLKRTSELLDLPLLKGVLDLRNRDIDTQVYLHMPNEYKTAAKSGRLPKPNLAISNNNQVTHLVIPSNEPRLEYITVENLPNLTSIVVKKSPNSKLVTKNGEIVRIASSPSALRWLICRNLPSLRSVVVEGGLYWLEIENAPSLEEIDVHKSSSLDYFSIRQCASLQRVGVLGCKKLRQIVNLPEAQYSALRISEQIEATQSQSKRNCRIYREMTYTDIDNLLENIHSFIAVAYEREWLDDYLDFSIKLGRPLEGFYSGGSGETCPYALEPDEDGCRSIEAGLSEIVDRIANELHDRYKSLRLGNSLTASREDFQKRLHLRESEILRVIRKYAKKC